ncbi:winged helix-turn-helix domain-containing protein [Streptomyces maoxianensis]|uniref:Winged helix-turn-helix domain-containing protein n=1 Tax=Streptomyces maoxianensis TaxID=1459942 RepID=A0ABV9GGH1_9ACTN
MPRQPLQRHAWSCQQPARRAAEQDRAAVAGWVKRPGPRQSHRGGGRGMDRL